MSTELHSGGNFISIHMRVTPGDEISFSIGSPSPGDSGEKKFSDIAGFADKKLNMGESIEKVEVRNLYAVNRFWDYCCCQSNRKKFFQ